MSPQEEALALWESGVRCYSEIGRRLNRQARTVWGWIHRERHNEYHRRYKREAM